MSKWEEELSKINDAYLILDAKTMEMVGLVEADEGRYDMQIAMKMASLGYTIMRLNFDELVQGGSVFKQKLHVRNATNQIFKIIEEGFDD